MTSPSSSVDEPATLVVAEPSAHEALTDAADAPEALASTTNRSVRRREVVPLKSALSQLVDKQLLSSRFLRVGSAIRCFPKEKLTLNEVLERVNAMLASPQPSEPAGRSGGADNSRLLERLQDQMVDLQAQIDDLRDESRASRRSADRTDRRAEPARQSRYSPYPARGYFENRDELYHGSHY